MLGLSTPILALAITLALSLAGNAAIGWQWLAARDQVATLQVERNQAQGAAGECSKGVADMQLRATAAARLAAPRVAAAAAQAASHDQRADQILASPPSTPGSDCQSAQARVQAWLQGRAAPASAPAPAGAP